MSDPAQNPPTPPAEKVEVPPAVANMQAGLDKAKATLLALPKPLKILIITTVATAVAIGAYFGVAPMLQDYRPLWTDLDPADAAAMVQVLDEKKIPYRLSAGGTAIEVPADRADATRLALAGEGRLPSGGKFGLDQLSETPIGTSEAMQKVLRQRAIEGELSRTIETIDAVKAARLHLVLHERSIFVQKVTPSRASITLELRPGAHLGPEQVQSIVNLVASAVPRLEPGNVSIVATDGTILHRPIREGEELGGGDALTQKMKHERALEDKVLSLVESIVGPGHAHVRISAEIVTAKVERKVDEYGDGSIETHRKTTEGGGPGAGIPDAPADGGTVGAESNIPQGDAVPPEGADAPAEVPIAAGAGRTDESRTYRVDHRQEREVGLKHDIKRLTVAVALDEVETMVDGEPQRAPLPPESITTIRSLVADAVGLDEKRGDDLQVASMPFHRPELPEAEADPVLLPIPDPYKKWVPLASRVGLGLAGLIAFLIVRRKLRKRAEKKAEEKAKENEVHDGELLPEGATKKNPFRAAELEGSAAADDKDAEPGLGAANPSDVDKLLQEAQRLDAAKIDRETKLETLRQIALERATGDAATAALVIRHWLGTAQADEQEAA